MKYDVYMPFWSKKLQKWCPGVTAREMNWDQVMELMSSPAYSKILNAIRSGEKDRKNELPAIDFVGKSVNGKRENQYMQPTQLVMLDVDHLAERGFDAYKVWEGVLERIRELDALENGNFLGTNILLAHRTPRGGLRLVVRALKGFRTLQENMDYYYTELLLDSKYEGCCDKGVHDFSRISFLVQLEDVFYANTQMLNADFEGREQLLVNKEFHNSMFGKEEPTSEEQESDKVREEQVKNAIDESQEQLEAQNEFADMEFRGTKVSTIIEKYVSFCGAPSTGEIHNFYNEMVKNFRCIMDNNKRALLAMLPRFGHSKSECESQIASICRANTLSSLPKQFYFFLKDNGFYVAKSYDDPKLKEFMMADGDIVTRNKPPYLPPIFREFVEICPPDFVVPCITALLPVVGTLTSYVQAEYPYDARMHTTSFFSVIYAPAGTGKGFVERIIDNLFEDLKLRDAVQTARENIYLRVIQKKGANDKSPDMPHVSMRLIPPKNSEAEFLQKQSDNHGYHMFTYAAEMDSWAKGSKAAGGNKDDMIRVAWDNGEYGQQFKSANTFKGNVRLYWNVLITGTLPQLESYFKNVENGLVTRCSFSSIDNQEFAMPPKWRNLSKKALNTLRKFMSRCDRMSYEEPCLVDPQMLVAINDDDFEKEIDWRFKFRERKTLDCSWIMPVIDAFQDEQVKLGLLDRDNARDVFRRRVGVRGFRLAMICMCLWENPKPSDLEKCKSFINWFMHVDLEESLKLWGQKYNDLQTTTITTPQKGLYASLSDEFDMSDLYAVATRHRVKTPLRIIIHQWKKIGVIDKVGEKKYRKTNNDGKGKTKSQNLS